MFLMGGVMAGLFKRVAVFEGLPDEWLAELEGAAEERCFAPNSIVFRRG